MLVFLPYIIQKAIFSRASCRSYQVELMYASYAVESIIPLQVQDTKKRVRSSNEGEGIYFLLTMKCNIQ